MCHLPIFQTEQPSMNANELLKNGNWNSQNKTHITTIPMGVKKPFGKWHLTEMGPEAKLWQWLRGQLTCAVGFKFERVENKASLSTPDLRFSWSDKVDGVGGHGWIELKVQNILNCHDLNKRIIKVPHFTAGQKEWLSSNGKMGGHCFLFLNLGGELMLFNHKVVCEVGCVNYTELKKSLCDKVWTKKTFDLNEFLKLITD